MSTILDRAKEALANLPEHDQAELVGELEKAAAERKLKALIDEGRASLERGEGRPLDIEEIIGKANARHAAGT